MRGAGRGADTDAGGYERRAGFERNRILVDGDAGLVKCLLSRFAGNVAAGEVDQHQVVVGAATGKFESALREPRRQRLGVVYYLLLICLEFRLQGFLESHRLGGNNVHQRAALNSGEYLGVQGFCKFLSTEDHAATRSTQGLVGGGGDEFGIGNRTGVHSGSHQTGEMRHIHHNHRTDLVGDSTKCREIDDTRIGAGANHDHLGLVLDSQALDLAVIDSLGLR